MQLALFQHPDDGVRQAWCLSCGADDVEAVADATLAVIGGRLVRDREGRAAGALAGVLFNDLEIGDDLVSRGLVADGCGPRRVAVESVAQFGPGGLGALRFQGVLAVIHRGQAGAFVARGPAGVAPTYARQVDGGWIVTTDLRVFEAIDPTAVPLFADSEPSPAHWVGVQTLDPRTRRLPTGVVAMIGGGGVRCAKIKWQPHVQPFYRDAPAVLRDADVPTAALLVGDAIADAVAATERALGPGMLGPTHNRCQHWLARLADHRELMKADADATWRWSLLGARTLCERMRWPQGLEQHDEVRRVAVLERAWMASFEGVPEIVRPVFPEPLTRVSAARAGQRWLRHTAFSNALAGRAFDVSARADWTIALPHLDPRVIATCGALDAEVLQRAVERVPGAPVATA